MKWEYKRIETLYIHLIAVYKKDIVNKKLHGVNVSIFIRFMIWYRIFKLMDSLYHCAVYDDKDINARRVPICNNCNEKSADIFQVEGEYCLDCWQKRTYPNL